MSRPGMPSTASAPAAPPALVARHGYRPASSTSGLAPRLAGMVKRGGEIALSGILHDQAEMVQQAYARDFSLQQPQQLEGWLLITGRRR